ncbi:MAG: creatininase family protein [Pseudomonadota bacterium]|nr:creatininase family protein [Pseudomonadota bacterium]
MLATLGLGGCGRQQASAKPVAPPSAPREQTVLLEDLTWTELRDEVTQGRTTVIIPVGGVEQSGPGIVLGKHNFRVAVLSARIARDLGNALVAPVVSYVPEGELSPPTQHMRFPGTITVPRAAFREVISSAANSLTLHGFKTVAILGDHGGYQGDLRAVVDELNRAWRGQPRRAVYVGAYYAASQASFTDSLLKRGFSSGEVGKHAGLADASLSLATTPAAVRLDRLRAGASSRALGVDGDPKRASAQLGELGAEMMVRAAVQQIRAARPIVGARVPHP